MTAEITVMNSSGVALAADSAVTVGGGSKIYNSANKLFSISKYHPVGVMIYGNANYLNMPWETIIKVYRNKLLEKNFSTLEEYTLDFFDFLKSNEYEEISSNEYESIFIMNTLESNIVKLFKTVLNSVKERANTLGDENYSDDEVDQILMNHGSVILEEKLSALDNMDYISDFDDDDITLLTKEYGNKIEDMIHVHFEKFLLSDDWVNKIKNIVCQSIIKKFSSAKSGIVFAGFGEKELYPSIHSFNIEGKVNGKIKCKKTNNKSIGKKSTAAIIPFAQSDMVHTFITGIDRDIERLTENYLENIFGSLPTIITDQLINEMKEETNVVKLKESIETELSKLYNKYKQEVDKFKHENFTSPVLQIVHSLPKEELADIAEALVNLTSFKKKVSSNLESVGGPIDVAVITKGDGFVWIKRKHYFDYEKNRHFFEKYYWRDENEKSDVNQGFRE